MIFGNPSKFAVEFELDENYCGRWMYGKFCYWIYNMRIGKYDEGESLRDVLASMPWLIWDNGNRQHPELFAMGTIDLYKKIDNALYGEGDTEDETWARFEIKILVGIFDEWKIYLVENDEKTRIITENLGRIREYELHPKEFDDAIRAAYDMLNEIYDREED